MLKFYENLLKKYSKLIEDNKKNTAMDTQQIEEIKQSITIKQDEIDKALLFGDRAAYDIAVSDKKFLEDTLKVKEEYANKRELMSQEEYEKDNENVSKVYNEEVEKFSKRLAKIMDDVNALYKEYGEMKKDANDCLWLSQHEIMHDECYLKHERSYLLEHKIGCYPFEQCVEGMQSFWKVYRGEN